MKKYISIIVMLILIVVPITTHYIMEAKANDLSELLQLETLSGDLSVLESTTLEGDYSLGYNYRPFTITEHGIEAKSAYTNQERLIDQYKSFMRGKNVYDGNFSETEHELISVEIDKLKNYYPKGTPYTLTIEVLDKASKNVQKLSVTSEMEQNTSWFTIYYVIKHGDTLKVYTGNDLQSGAYQLVEHTIDLNSEQLLTTQTIDFANSEKTAYMYAVLLNDGMNLEKETNMVLVVQKEDVDDEKVNDKDFTLYLFNTETSELKELDKVKDPYNDVVSTASAMMFANNKLSMTTSTNSEITVQQFDIEKDEWLPTISIPFPIQISESHNMATRIIDDKIYTIANVDKGLLILINSSKDGTSLFEGIINNEHDLEISIHDIYRD